MAIIISGPGVGLPYPANLYPSELNNAPDDFPTNFISLAPGQVINIPAGNWAVDGGAYCMTQFLDPVTGIWRFYNSARQQPNYYNSDGFTRRVGNFTGCAISAIVTNGGSGFSNSTATITSNVGGSQWDAIVGGSLSVSTITAAGADYTMPPELFIPAPPNPGIQATGYAVLTSGTVSA
jgi:hypothetical protein